MLIFLRQRSANEWLQRRVCVCAIPESLRASSREEEFMRSAIWVPRERIIQLGQWASYKKRKGPRIRMCNKDFARFNWWPVARKIKALFKLVM